MFNQPKAAAPAPGPPPRATKPRAFKWKTSGEADEGSSKAVSVADVPPPAPTPTPGAQAAAPAVSESQQPAALTDKPGAPQRMGSTSSSSGAPLEPVSSAASGASVISAEDSIKHKGFSAEDARQTAGSLKERIALLSGLKVDKPDAPGRAPKPWRKKTQEPEAGEEQAKSPAEAASPSSAEVTNAPALSAEHASDTEPGDTTKPKEEDAESGKPADQAGPSTTESQPTAHDVTSTTSPESHGIALPAMPTRARGPQRKARSGGAAATASPTVQSPAAEEPSGKAPLDRPKPDIPSVADIGSPAAGPEELGNPIPAAELEKDGTDKEAPGVAEEKSAEIVAGDEAAVRSPPKRASTGLIAQGIPLPPATAARAAGTEDNRDEEEEEGKAEAGQETDVNALQAGLAKQSLQDDDAPMPAAPASVPSPISRPPAPPALDTQFAGQPSGIASPADVTSPVSSNANRRSMTRPPVPTGYSQASAPTSASPRSSFDNRSQRSSMVESNRNSLIMSPTPPEIVSAEPEHMAGDGEFANPALDSKEKEVLPPPVSKPFDTESDNANEGSMSPARRDSMPLAQQRRQSGAPAAGPAVGGSTPVRTASIASQKSARAATAEREEEQETNISAMRAYRSTQPEETSGVKDGEEEEDEYEDPEVARRQALAKRMAAMGGMKLGMLPQMPSMMKKKKPPPKEAEASESTETAPLSPPPPPPAAPASSSEKEVEEDSPVRPPAQTARSFKPPAGAFVLPMPGRPPVPPPAVPPPPAPEEEEEEEAEEQLDPDDEPMQEPDAPSRHGDEDDAEIAGDDTLTQPMEDDDEPLTPLPPPPPVPAARPPPPPPAQSFIETDTDTDGGRSDKRTSMASSTGVGSLSDFPAPPPVGAHVRTESSASRYSSTDQPETLHEEPEQTEDFDDQSERTEAALPPRPVRRAPTLDTSIESSGGGRTPSRRESMAEPASPSQSVHSYSQRSLPETPVSPSSHSASQERFGALSPTTSQSSRRSSAMMSGPPQGVPTPGLNNDYLAYIAHSSSKTKSREVDGPLAHTLNDIAYTYRNDPTNFGTPVYRMVNTGVKGQIPELEFHGRIDPGCVFFAWDAKFDRGLGRSSLKVGSAEVPHVGIVAEGVKDIKKAKVKVVELVQGRHNVETYRLDDLKSGTVEIRKLA